MLLEILLFAPLSSPDDAIFDLFLLRTPVEAGEHIGLFQLVATLDVPGGGPAGTAREKKRKIKGVSPEWRLLNVI